MESGVRGELATLRPRLAAVAQLVPPGSRVADVGTGHALLPHALLLAGRARHCIATETESAAEIRAFEPGHGSKRRLEIRRGDGLSVLRANDRLDVLVLAGLGSRTIVRLLDHPRREALQLRRLVLQPQTEPALLRGWLRRRGLGIVEERLARERGRFYVAVAAEPGAPAHADIHGLDEADLDEVGPCLARSGDPQLLACWAARQAREERILARARGAGHASAQLRFERGARVLAALNRW